METYETRPKAYSYLRFSRPEQGLGDSLRRQLDGARKYADEHGLDLDESLRDEGISAFRSKNRDDKSALGSFLRKVKNGDVPKGSYLLVENLDRLSRDQVTKALLLFLDILDSGIIIVSLGDKRVYSWDSVSESESELLISISAMTRAHGESELKSVRVSEAWERKRSEAERTGKAMTKICPGWIEKRGDHYVLIEERAQIVRRIFEMCIDGMGTRTIAKTLNSESVEPWGRGKKKGRIWYDSYIKKILDNPATYGEFSPRGRLAGGSDATASPPLRNYFPAAIDTKTFKKARAMLEARANSSVRSTAGKHRNVLSGLLKCEACGGGMHYIDKGKKGGRPYLQCGNSLLKGGCRHGNKHVYETLETVINYGLLINCGRGRE
jgi:DNA invertase Pin-like site-specific DNA recombinase